LDQYKTQVLLLHSEQSTLDKFSSGFDDRYTVHCARTGTEALTTLGETPIHVIVSAQKLPGMSGAEALREAKKRSPDTIGILLAGDSSEALVGEKEVFQVIRGGVDPSHLRQLIDNATQQSRLIALAESANDTRANPDEPVAEHIIMETSENGSSIITDATGQLPALDPKKISATAVGAATVDVLVITKDQEFLTTIQESSRGVHTVHYANTLKQAEEAVRKNKVGVSTCAACANVSLPSSRAAGTTAKCSWISSTAARFTASC
jgi:CheY-like chemotaxis protein